MDSIKKYETLKKKYRKIYKNCEICSSKDRKKIQSIGRIAKPGDYGSLNIYICTNCGHKFQNPTYPYKFFKEYYDILYREIAFGNITPSKRYQEEQIKRGKGVFDWFNKIKNKNLNDKAILDHGCASGLTMSIWKKKGWKSFGVDPHRPSVEIGKKNGFNIKIGVGEKLPFKSDSFSVVMSLGSLEHSYDLNKSLKEIRRVLNANGILLVRWRSDKIFGSPLEYYNHNHYRFFTKKTWKLALEKFGFRILEQTEKKLEGVDSYEYFLAKKTSRNKLYKPNKLKFNYKKEIMKLKDIRYQYYINSKQFIDFYKNNKKKKDFLLAFSQTNLKNKWGFLGGNKKIMIERSFMEAKLYVEKYENGEVY